MPKTFKGRAMGCSLKGEGVRDLELERRIRDVTISNYYSEIVSGFWRGQSVAAVSPATKIPLS